jgi:CHAT domain-containing protein
MRGWWVWAMLSVALAGPGAAQQAEPADLIGLAETSLAAGDASHADWLEEFLHREVLRGTADPMAIGWAMRLAEARLRTPGHEGRAIRPARSATDMLRRRRYVAATDLASQAQARREHTTGIRAYELLADAAWESNLAGTEAAGDLSEAFEALQEATSGEADRAVTRTAARRLAEAAGPRLGALVRERETLEARWLGFSRDYDAAIGSRDAAVAAHADRIRAERAPIDARIAEIDAELRRDFQRYFWLIEPQALDQLGTQRLLAPDEALLIVVPTERGTHVMALSRDDAGWIRSNWARPRVDAAVRRLLWDVGAAVQVPAAESARWEAEGGPGYPFDRATAHALWRELVAPMARVLDGKRHVFIAAGGSLSSLPFGLLVAAPPQGADGDPAALRATRWFADSHALVQLPSIQSLEFLRGRYALPGTSPDAAAATGGGGFAGFGDPVLEGEAQTRGGGRGSTRSAPGIGSIATTRTRSGGVLASPMALRRLSRLPGTAIELANMRHALGAPGDALRLGERATERAFRATDLRGVRILALATHGLLAGELAGTMEPGLVFTPPTAPSEADDGLLTASEIAALRLDAEWVILSACNTAAGDGTAGAPGLSGLARAFFYAGARTLLASHWPVRDDVAARLTVRTIELQRAQPGRSRAEAFQLAMREIRNDPSHDTAESTWAHPNAWAPFSLIGDGAR